MSVEISTSDVEVVVAPEAIEEKRETRDAKDSCCQQHDGADARISYASHIRNHTASFCSVLPFHAIPLPPVRAISVSTTKDITTGGECFELAPAKEPCGDPAGSAVVVGAESQLNPAERPFWRSYIGFGS